jgi:uncharacterized protein (DUF983 family)
MEEKEPKEVTAKIGVTGTRAIVRGFSENCPRISLHLFDNFLTHNFARSHRYR